MTLLVAVVAALALVIVGCGDNDSESGDSSSSGGGSAQGDTAVKSSLTLGVNNPNYATQMVIFVAKDKGYLKEVGIDDIRVITTDNFVQGLVGGSLDISQGDTDQWFNAAAVSGKPVKYIASFRDKEYEIMGGAKGITSVEDLEGKNVTAGQRGGRNEYVVKSLLEANGLDPSKVKFVPLGGGSDARLQALINGQVAGASIFPRHIAALEREGGKVLYEDLAKVPQEGIAVMGDFLDENKATVVAYLTANLKARQFIADPANKDEIIKIMKDNDFDVIPDFTAVFQHETEQISPDGGFSVASMDELVDQETKIGLMPEGLDWREYVDVGPLNEAQEAVGMKENPTPAELAG